VSCPPYKYRAEKTISSADAYLADCVDRPPTANGLANHLGVTKRALYDWKYRYPKFAPVLERLNCLQETMLLDKGLAGVWDSHIVKLMLGKHGYKRNHSTSPHE